MKESLSLIDFKKVASLTGELSLQDLIEHFLKC